MGRAEGTEQTASGDEPATTGQDDSAASAHGRSTAPARKFLLIGGVLAVALAAAVGASLIGEDTASPPAETAPATSAPAGGPAVSDSQDGTPEAGSEQGEEGEAGEQDATDAPTQRPTISADLDLDAAVAGDATAVTQAGNDVLSAQAEAFEDPAAGPDMAAVLAGPALAEYETSLTQLAAEGLRQQGAATIDSVEVVEASEDRTVARVCVDSSQVRVTTLDGVDVTTPGRPERSAMIVTFLSEDGAWRLHESRFADDPNC